MGFLVASQVILLVSTLVVQASKLGFPALRTVEIHTSIPKTLSRPVSSITATHTVSAVDGATTIIPTVPSREFVKVMKPPISAVPADSEINGLIPTITVVPDPRVDIGNRITAVPYDPNANITATYQYGLTGSYDPTPTVEFFHRRGHWTLEHVKSFHFPTKHNTDVPPNTVLILSVPKKLDDWVERVTFDNSHWMKTMRNDTQERIMPFGYTAKTTDGVCIRSATHNVTIQRPPHAPERWVTEMTFHKMSQGYACGGHPGYPDRISRCMGVYTTPYTLQSTHLEKLISSHTIWLALPGGITSSIVKKSIYTSTSVTPIVYSRVHWGERWPELHQSDAKNFKGFPKPCKDEMSCYHYCEHTDKAITRTLIILGSVLGGLLLILAPIIYFWSQPRHLRRMRDRVRRRRLEKSDRLAVGPEKRGITAGEVLARQHGTQSQTDGNEQLGLGTSEGRPAPRRMSTEYDRLRREQSKKGWFGRFGDRLLGRAD